MNRLTNAMISAASARVRDTRIDVRVGGSRGALEKRHGGHDHPGLTVTALRHVKLLPCKLHRVRTIDGQAFNGGDRGADCSFHRNGARTNGSAVHVHRARPALADPATVLRTREIDRIANSPEKRCVRFHIDDVPKPVNGKRESHERPSSEIHPRALNLRSCLPRPRANKRIEPGFPLSSRTILHASGDAAFLSLPFRPTP